MAAAPLTPAQVLARLAEALRSAEGKDAEAKKSACREALSRLKQLPGAQEAFLAAFLDEGAAMELREALVAAWVLKDPAVMDRLLSKLPSLSVKGQELGIRLATGPMTEELRREWARHPELLELLLSLESRPDPEVSERAQEGLACLAPTQIRAWMYLEEAALDFRTEDRQVGALYLLLLADPTRAVPVVLRLLQDPDLSQRGIVTHLLLVSFSEYTGRPEIPQPLYEAILPPLKRVLADPAEDVFLRTRSLGVLLGRRSDWMKGELVRIVEDPSEHPDLQDAAAAGLGLYQDDPLVLEKIRTLALRAPSKDDPDPPGALRALSARLPSKDPACLARKEAVLLSLLRESNASVRACAIEVLEECGGEAVLGPLEEIQRGASSERERQNAGVAITQIRKRLAAAQPPRP